MNTRESMSAQPVENQMSRDYVAFMTCDAGDGWMPQVEAQTRDWLKQKGFDVSFTESADHLADNAHLAVRRIDGDGAHDIRIQLTEHSPQTGSWTTELIAHDEPGKDDWVALTVRNSAGSFVAVPRLARYLMAALPLRDSALEYTPTPQVFHVADLDRLLEMLEDGERHGLVFVAGTKADDGIPFDAFLGQVEAWLRETPGLAQVVVLDPPATAAFDERVGHGFSAPPWAIRTYLPGVDLTSPTDARRHRILGTNRLATQSDRRTSYLFGEIARNHANSRNTIGRTQRARRRFERTENRRLFDSVDAAPAVVEPTIASAPPTAPADGAETRIEPAASLLGLVKRVLHLDEITEAALHGIAARLRPSDGARSAIEQLQARVDTLQTRAEHLEDQTRVLDETLRDEQMERELVQLDLDGAAGRVKWLESRLHDLGDYEPGYTSVPEEFLAERPCDFAELLDRIESLPGVVFSGDQDAVLGLSVIDTNDSALRSAWDAVLTLVDYVRARESGDWTSGLKQYIAQTPAGYASIGPKKFAHTETAITMSAHGSERLFPVPAHVPDAPKAEMKAHFKLARIGMLSPRMYILDRNPQEPVVYIGYIGPHLTNTQS